MNKNIKEKRLVINKAALSKRVADKTGVSHKLAAEILNSTLDEITACLAEGIDVRLVGFGTFERRLRRGRKGHNPRSPEEKVYIPAHYIPSFKAGRGLKEAIKKD